MKLNSIIRKRLILFFVFLFLPIISLIFIYLTYNQDILENLDYRHFLYFTKNVGFYGVFIFAIPIGLFVFRFLMKYTTPKGVTTIDNFLSKIKINIPTKIKERYFHEDYLSDIRSIFVWFAKLLKRLHIPVSLLAISVIGYHVYLAFHSGWIWNLEYISGLIAAIFLVIITITGIARMFNKGIKTHKFLMFGFIIFTVLHILLV